MGYLEVGSPPADVVNGLWLDLPADDDHEDCMSFTNVCIYVGLRRTIEIYSPFCALHMNQLVYIFV